MPRTFEEATSEVEGFARSKGRAGEAPGGEKLDGVILFDTAPNTGTDLVSRNHEQLLASGAFLFLYMHGFGRKGDTIGLAPTTDKFDVIRRVGTDGANYGHDNRAVIEWLREIERTDAFDLRGAGPDFVEGTFREPVKNVMALSERIHSFCPDFVNQGLGLTEEGEPHALIQEYFASNRAFFFWWD